MRAHQSPDQLVAGAWSRGQVAAGAALSRHGAGPTLHEHGHPVAHQAVPQRVEPAVTCQPTPACNICAHTITTALPLRATHPTNTHCAPYTTTNTHCAPYTTTNRKLIICAKNDNN